jgi:ComF family protein
MCEKPSVDHMTHHKCKRPRTLDASVSVFEYRGVVRKAILALKYRFVYDIYKELALSIINKIKTAGIVLPTDAVLIPVPLHSKRKKWRGFNQVSGIGNLLARQFGWNFVEGLIIRKRFGLPQAGLLKTKRAQNVRNTFEQNPFYKHTLEGAKTVIIFDDVYTTGSTIKEVGKVVKRNGAGEVWGLTIAK